MYATARIWRGHSCEIESILSSYSHLEPLHMHMHRVNVCATIPPPSIIASDSQNRFNQLNWLACDPVIPQPDHKR
eukprot:1748689-Alexandrium_andersonii.AAC.1